MKKKTLKKPKLKRPKSKILGTGTARKAADKASAYRKRTEAALNYK